MSKHLICPVCSESAHERTSPFCSARCREMDLNRWLSGNYGIAGEDGEALLEMIESGHSELLEQHFRQDS